MVTFDESPITLNMEMCMVVFSPEFIDEHFPVLPARLSKSQEVYLEELKSIHQKCEAHLLVIHKLHYVVKDIFGIPTPTTNDESVASLVPRHTFIQYKSTIKHIELLWREIHSMQEEFERYEQISPMLSEYWSIQKDHLPKAIKQVAQMKPALEQRKKDLALFKKQRQGAKGKAKRSDKNHTKELKSLESQVKMAQAEMTSAQQSVSRMNDRIAELKGKVENYNLVPNKSLWEEKVSKSYDKFRQLTKRLQEQIGKIHEVFARFKAAKYLASACITQNDIDKEMDECPICLRDYSVGENVKVCGYCKKYVDEECMDRWLKENDTCPLCRQSPFNASK